MISARRSEEAGQTGTGEAVNYGGFTQIGHLGLPSGDVTVPTTANYNANATYNGNITVQVGGNLTQQGGTTLGTNDLSGLDARPVVLAFNHIGHGGPDVDGPKAGIIDVTVGGNYTASDGMHIAHDNSTVDGGNYVQVGHGDWLRVRLPEALTGFPLSNGTGNRTGDIYVKVGETATLDQVLVGHGDFASQSLLNTIGQGNTYFGVSRNNPFQSTGTGELIARNGTVFSSAFYGATGELRIYIPKRELNKMEHDTLLNTAVYASGTPGEAARRHVVESASSRRSRWRVNCPAVPTKSTSTLICGCRPAPVVVSTLCPAMPRNKARSLPWIPTGDIGNLTGLTDNGQLGSGTATYAGW